MPKTIDDFIEHYGTRRAGMIVRKIITEMGAREDLRYEAERMLEMLQEALENYRTEA